MCIKSMLAYTVFYKNIVLSIPYLQVWAFRTFFVNLVIHLPKIKANVKAIKTYKTIKIADDSIFAVNKTLKISIGNKILKTI